VEYPDQAVLYKEQLKKIGIEATIKLEESATGFQRYMRGDWVMGVQASGNFILAPDAILGKTWMPTGNFASIARSVPPQWWQDAYIQQAGERDRDKRKAILRKMEDFLIFEDPGGCAVAYWSARNWIFNNRLKGIHASGSIWAGYKHDTDWVSHEA
jgi:ABC-type transport system substrate-binding protein